MNPSPIEFYSKYSYWILNYPHMKDLDAQWSRDGTKERTWIELYKQMEIPQYLKDVLYKSDDKNIEARLQKEAEELYLFKNDNYHS